MVEQAVLVRQIVDEVHPLFDVVVPRRSCIDLDAQRGACHALCHVANHSVERRREQHRLARARRRGNDPFDVLDETHVQHAVGFVQDQDLQLREIDLAGTHVVDQTTRRGHQDLGVAAEEFHLLRVRHATEDGYCSHLVKLAAVFFGGGGDLQREFAGWCQYQHARLRRLETMAIMAAGGPWAALRSVGAGRRRALLRGKEM
ncbi:MAG: hypothetical protein AW09_001664 [Candidatus Accumulibacter phosphatis]|uniref:Uncharacterized protein n=1 Tax=Candidatus Accumulibacter phosphatis TaxID=327160 RepID=A0A080LWG9_9PROT|nr:MAG: hypothetical protein AW09_001664 [Candidatus Accumulibacter phosphatis]